MEKKFNQIAYQNAYIKEKYDRIELAIPKGQKAVIKERAKQEGKSVTEFIWGIIKEHLD